MNVLKEILDRVAELNVMFLAIDGKETTGEKMGGIDMITISWHLLMLIVIIAGLWIFTFTRDNSGQYVTSRDLWSILSFVLTIILILIYGGLFWW